MAVLLASSGAAAVVLSVLYFLLVCANVFNLAKTRFNLYAIVIVASVFKLVSYSARAAILLGTYHDSLEGVYLAFTNAGYGVNIVALYLFTSVWFQSSPVTFPALERTIYGALFRRMVPIIIIFGPVMGVCAAVSFYGSHTEKGFNAGMHFKKAATGGLFAMVAICWLLLLRISLVTVLQRTPTSPEAGAGNTFIDVEANSGKKPIRHPRLIVVLWVCATLLLLRGVVGVMSLGTSYTYLISEDDYSYPLIELPHLLCMTILSIPTLVARIALVYPLADA